MAYIGERNEKEQKRLKARGWGQSGQEQNLKGNKKPSWGKKGSGNAVQGNNITNFEGTLSSRSGAALAMGART